MRSTVYFAYLVDLHDVRMLQACQSGCFLPEPSQLLVAGSGANDFERNLAVESAVHRSVNDAVAASAQFGNNLVAGNIGFDGRSSDGSNNW